MMGTRLGVWDNGETSYYLYGQESNGLTGTFKEWRECGGYPRSWGRREMFGATNEMQGWCREWMENSESQQQELKGQSLTGKIFRF